MLLKGFEITLDENLAVDSDSRTIGIQSYLLIITLLGLLVWILKNQLFDSTSAGLPLPPGPTRWPILGSIPALVKENSSYSHLQFAGLAEKYGPILSFGFGVHYGVIISSYKLYKEIFQRPDTNIERFGFDFMGHENNYKNLGVAFSGGNVWKEQRSYVFKKLNQFGFGKKLTMDSAIEEEVEDLVTDIEKEVISTDGIWEVNINRISVCLLNILWAFVGGYRFEPHSPKINRMLELNIEIVRAIGPDNLLAPLPFLRKLPALSGYKRYCEIMKDFREYNLELIEDAKLRREGRIEPESFLDIYLDDIKKNKNNPDTTLTEEQLVQTIVEFNLGGFETSSSLTNWIILYLTLYQDVQIKARAEIEKITERGSTKIRTTTLASMPYCQAVVWEALRHCPLTASSSPRKAMEDIEIAGYRIPKGTALFPNFFSIQNDKSNWKDPEVFRPERLLLPDGSLNHKMIKRIVIFGTGSRVCPGEILAFNSTSLIMTGLLQRFMFQVIPSEKPTIEPGKPSLVLRPKPFAVKLKLLQ